MVQLSREAVAAQEIGRTDIGHRTAVLVSLLFVLLIFAVPVVQYFVDSRTGTAIPRITFSVSSGPQANLWIRITSLNSEVLRYLDDMESHLEEGSILRQLFLPPLQLVFAGMLGQGNEQVVVGRNGELFYAPDIDTLIGPPFLESHQLDRRTTGHELWEAPLSPDPRPAIFDFHHQLARRGISLMVVVIPSKAAVEPEKLTGATARAPLANRSWSSLADELAAQGVAVFDGRQLLRDYAEQHGDAFLTTDSHWLPGAIKAFTEELAATIRVQFPEISNITTWQRREAAIVGVGDIAQMLVLPSGSMLYPPEEVVIQQVFSDGDELWQANPAAPLLLLGDSFANIYSLDGLGWGRGAGLAEQLSYSLRSSIDLLARNDGGASTTRQMLADEMGRGRDRLAGKQLVVWQFAERELAKGDWKNIELRLGEARSGQFFQAPQGDRVTVRGVVGSIARSPRPGSVPYRDNILTLHLVDLQTEPAGNDQALVYTWGMRDNQLTEVAGLRPGDRVEFALQSWAGLENEYGGYRRAPLDDPLIELEFANWGELLDVAMD